MRWDDDDNLYFDCGFFVKLTNTQPCLESSYVIEFEFRIDALANRLSC